MFILSIFVQPACLLAIRPTSDGKVVRSCFSHDKGYHRSLVLIKIYPLHHSDSFILHCFSISLTNYKKVRNHKRGINKL